MALFENHNALVGESGTVVMPSSSSTIAMSPIYYIRSGQRNKRHSAFGDGHLISSSSGSVGRSSSAGCISSPERGMESLDALSDQRLPLFVGESWSCWFCWFCWSIDWLVVGVCAECVDVLAVGALWKRVLALVIHTSSWQIIAYGRFERYATPD